MIAQEFKRAVIRRLAYVLVASALAAFGWFAGIGEAKAQSTPDKGEAYAQCQAYLQNSLSHIAPENKRCLDGGTKWAAQRFASGIWHGAANFDYVACPSDRPWDEATKTCKVDCTTKPDLGETWVKGTANSGGSSICHDGCLYVGELGNVVDDTTVDGSRYTKYSSMNPWGTNCTVGGAGDGNGSGESPPSDGDGDGISDGNDGSPNNPGSTGGGGEDGSGNDVNGDGDSNDPGEGSGNGNTAGGGGDCSNAPHGTGDALLSMIAYQSWATRCAIENSKNSDGTLKVKVEGSGSGTGEPGGGDGTDMTETNDLLDGIKGFVEEIRDFIDGLGTEADGLDTEEGELEEADSIWGESPAQAELDSSGYGLGGSCPAPPSYNGISLDPDGNLCMFAQIIGALVLVGAYAQAAYIIGRA